MTCIPLAASAYLIMQCDDKQDVKSSRRSSSRMRGGRGEREIGKEAERHRKVGNAFHDDDDDDAR